MKQHRAVLPAALILCATAAYGQDRSELLAAVDAPADMIAANVDAAGMATIVEIDHSRLAEDVGVPMPPSRVILFSDPAIEAPILAENIRAGLDLPMRALAYWQDEGPALKYTGSDFLAARHGLTDAAALAGLDGALASALAGVDAVSTPVEGLALDYGIIEFNSPFDLAESVERLKAAVMSQDDTVWFGEVDFTAEAASVGVDLPPSRLLLFGGPGPGGVAMADFPSIGLDAFCQKLLIYEDGTGAVRVLFNGIAALAELHYGASAEPHAQLDARLTQTFRGALGLD